MLTILEKQKGRTVLQSRQTRCHLTVYHFRDQNIETYKLDADKYELFDDIISMTYNNNILTPDGQWQIKITPSKDYSKLISPGDWVQCYLTTHTGEKYRRFIGNVDRISLDYTMGEDGTKEIYFSISGRDWGKVFVDTTIWYNPYFLSQVEAILMNKLNGPKGSPNQILKNIIDLFLNDTVKVAGCSSTMSYWYLSNIMAQDLGSAGHPQFADVLDLSDFDKSYPGYQFVPLLNTQGNVWNILKSLSNEAVYTLFCDEQDGIDSNGKPISRPKLFFTTRPYSFRTANFKKIPPAYFLDLPAATITGNDIISFNIGLSDHDRFNVFYILMKQEPIKGLQASIYVDKPESFLNRNSIKRHGLRLFERVTDYNFQSENNNLILDVYEESVNLLTSWYKGNHLLENGTFNIIGNPEIRLGKRLVVQDNPLLPNRQYYIEAFSDSWVYGDIWRQTVEVSRGISVIDGQEKYAYEDNASLYPVSTLSKVNKNSFKSTTQDASEGVTV